MTLYQTEGGKPVAQLCQIKPLNYSVKEGVDENGACLKLLETLAELFIAGKLKQNETKEKHMDIA